MTEAPPHERPAPRRGDPREPWNHNIQYFPFIVGLVGEKPRATALDAGAGDGMLARLIAETVPTVVALDADAAVVERAALRNADADGLTFVHGDLLDPVAGEPFDVVTASSVLHHVPLDAGLERLRDLTAPGGTLIVVGLAVERSPLDWIVSLASIVPNRIARGLRGWHDHGAPRHDPEHGYGEIHAAATRILPGSQFRRRLYWRYTIVWQRPSPPVEERASTASPRLET
ncbi:class I SAM-dependent methyltransferase [Galbitalea sp. SE-J8]|uniref:class I SAM-dependent methyltransferase n=1 Tax=Galbitalea sp. SE-J8 TaxID=3054952 RepID=UPI00259D2499|nr:class I SAM-dependent methyltransferase [Galbitalea sp. SE-J8]MDM4764372.1 class I SAM-dependent methyltransferase [Galbitalea sp. SE-J8]